jgi:DNA helicase-2/ATP-dependent DNA helicase PcrA
LAEAATARRASDSAVDWINDIAGRFSEVLIETNLLTAAAAVALRASAVEMVTDIRGRPGGNELTVEELGVFAMPEQCIQLMTVHKAKGREFDAVALIDAHDGRFPHFSIENVQDESEREAIYDESRRVVYVATTRAKRILMFFTDTSHGRNQPTPFLSEMGL